MKPNKMGIVLGTGISLCVLIAPTMAQDIKGKLPFKPNPARGHETSKKLCRACHVVDRQQKSAAQPGIPSFFYMANKSQQTPEKLATTMIHPFPPMIDIHLTTHEIKDISAYILSLKSQK